MPVSTMAIMLRPDKDEPDGMGFYLWPVNRLYYCDDDDVKIAEIDVPFEVPGDMTHEDIAKKAVETLEEKQKNEWARAQRRVDMLQIRINKLRMLTHQPAPENINNEGDGKTYEHDSGHTFGHTPIGEYDF